ncbi:MAG: translational GTPase TypA [Magnetovibrio sp.]|nr:translational GTPase TypA [Magnetovibrio sp.]
MEIRNIAIIAHVDHGKTTLVDALLQYSGAFRKNQQVTERAMDTGELERERGITILAKCTSVDWNGMRINIVDTPGHADFGGEVERILSMVDGVLLLVDASEGPMPQTKFVTAKALKIGLKPILIINKADKPEARAYEVQDEVFDLFTILEAEEDQLDFPTIFASAKEAWAGVEPDDKLNGMKIVFDQVLAHVPPPKVDLEANFSMLVTTLEADPYLGRILIGRIATGSIKPNALVKAVSGTGDIIEQTRITKVLGFRGLKREGVDFARAGDIVALAGPQKASVADTICDFEVPIAIESQPVDPPTLAVTFSVNDSPFAGQEGSKLTSREIHDRLMREAEGNVAIRVSENKNKDAFEVAGRGELQLGVLIEQMRREGFELSISRPRVLFKNNLKTGDLEEPFEELQIDVDKGFSGAVVEAVSQRKGNMTEMIPTSGGKVRLAFLIPSRGLIGYHGEFLTETRGTGVMNRVFNCYAPIVGSMLGRRNGVLISNTAGKSIAYGLAALESRGPLFIGSGAEVYAGMIIGEHSRANDLEVNPIKSKQLTNFRASGSDDAIRLVPPKRMTLEQAIAYIQDDELVEVTPQHIRLRKKHLIAHERKRAQRVAELG